MGQQYKENYKRATGRAPGDADSPNDLLRLEDGLTSISGGIIGAGLTTVSSNANGELVISSSGDGAGTLAAISGEIVGVLGTTVVANGANELEISSAVPSTPSLSQVLAVGDETTGNNVVLSSGDSVIFNDENSMQDIGVARVASGLLEITNPNDGTRTSIIAAGIPRRLHVNTSVVGNVGGGEDDLMSYVAPLDTLTINHDIIYVEAWGDLAGNSGTRTINFVIGGVILFTSTLAAGFNNRGWQAKWTIVRTSSTEVEVAGFTLAHSSSTVRFRNTVTVSDLASNTLELKFTGEDSNSNTDEVQQYGMIVDYTPAPRA